MCEVIFNSDIHTSVVVRFSNATRRDIKVSICFDGVPTYIVVSPSRCSTREHLRDDRKATRKRRGNLESRELRVRVES